MKKISSLVISILLMSSGIFSQKMDASEKWKRIELTLKYGNSEQVRRAIDQISTLPENDQKALIPELKKLFETRDILIRAKLGIMVSRVKWNDLDDKVVPLLEEKNRDVFFNALTAIEKKKIIAALPVIEKMIRESDFAENDNKLQDMLRTVGKLGASEINALLMEKLMSEQTHTENKNVILVYFSDIKYNQQNLLDYLVKNLEDSEISLTHKRYIAYAMGKLKIPNAREMLTKELKKIDDIEDIDEKKKYRLFRMQIINSLIELGDKDVEKILIEMAKDDDEAIRIRAINQIAELKMESARDMLEFKVKYDSSMAVINAAKEALKKLDEEKKNGDKKDNTGKK